MRDGRALVGRGGFALCAGLFALAGSCGQDRPTPEAGPAAGADAAGPSDPGARGLLPAASFPLRPVVSQALARLDAQLGAGRPSDGLPPSMETADPEHVHGLARILAGADGSLAALAREEIAALGDGAVLELVRLASDSLTDDGERAAALELLAAVDTVWATEELLNLVETAAPAWVRAHAVWLLGSSGQDWVVPRLILRLKYEKDHETVLWIAEALARFENYAGLAGAFVIWNEGASEELRSRAAECLVDITERAGTTDAAVLAQAWQQGTLAGDAPKRSARYDREILRWIQRFSEFQLRGVDDARFVLERSGTRAASWMAEALHDENVYVRVHTAQSLERMGPRAAPAARTLIEALDEPALAPNAAAALGRLRHEPAQAPLLARLVPGTAPELFLAIVRALGSYGEQASPAVARALCPLVEHPSVEVRQAAAESLVLVGADDPPLPLLAGLLTDERVEPRSTELVLEAWLAEHAAPADLQRWNALALPSDRIVPAEERAHSRRARRELIEALLDETSSSDG